MTEPRLPRDAILVDFYPGAYGPTILIDVQAEAALRVLRAPFLDLANRRTDKVDLLRLEIVFRSATISSLVLQIASEMIELEGQLELTPGQETNHFQWTNSIEGWLHAVDLLDALAIGGRPAHQYLIEPPASPAGIVVQFLEGEARNEQPPRARRLRGTPDLGADLP